MNLSLRQQKILKVARQQGQVLVDELVNQFSVTPQTIRKDLNELCEKGVLGRVHGGAVLASGIANVGYEQRQHIAFSEKQSLAQLCARHIPDNSSLFINIGTTTEAVANALLNHRDLMVVTNNLNVANILLQNPGFEIIVAGGVLRHSDRAIIGEATVDFVRQFRLDYAVVGISALDEDGTLLDYDYREVKVTQAILQSARQTCLVTDKSKLERKAPVRVGHVSQLSDLFMDELPSAELREVCQQHEVNVHTVIG
ncbi:MAG: DeoR/GlpR family DNA-binding transcription regulator [Thiolinea sp.]